ncbi:retrovirus-related pol polyprotein from transposon TNT 1-94 [Tanacetum coccineum]
MLAPKGSAFNGRPTFANPMYLKKAQSKKLCLYEIPYDTFDLANKFAPDREETLTLDPKSRSKLNKDLVKLYDYTKQNNLYEIFKPPSQEHLDQLAHANEVRKKMWRKSFVKSKPNIVKNIAFLSVLKSISKNAYTELQCLYLHKVKECEYLVEKLSKHTESVNEKIVQLILFVINSGCTKYMTGNLKLLCNFVEKYLGIVRFGNDQFAPILSYGDLVQGKITINRVYYVEGLNHNLFSLPHHTFFPLDAGLDGCVPRKSTYFVGEICQEKTSLLNWTTQTRALQLPQTSRNTNPRVSTCTGVTHRTSVSRPQLSSTQMKEKVMHNNSQMKFKKTKVEDRHMISNISNKTKSVTTCNDSLKSRTLNVNVVCATCEKLLPIRTRKPKSQANKFAATPHKKKVESDFTIQKSKSYFRMLYENTSKAWKWWIVKQCPSGYKWIPKMKKKWVPKVKKEDMNTSISPTIDNTSRIINVLKITNTLGSNLLNVPSSSKSLEDYATHPIHYLEVSFRKSTCLVRDLQGNDLLVGNRGSDLYTISLQDTSSPTPICFLAKASPTQACEQAKAKRSTFKTKAIPSSKGWLNLLYMELCGPMRIESINGKKYILVIVDDYSQYTWTLFLRTKDETPEVLKDFLNMIQRNLQSQVITIHTDRGTEFLNKTLHAYFKEEGIEHQTSTPRTPEQNSVVERQNRTLVEAAGTMLSASKIPLFFWAETIATACYTQNRSIIIPRHEKTPYHIINGRKTSIKHLYMFGCTCYINRDGKSLDKMKEKGDSCILVGYSTQSKEYRVYNKRTRLIVESIHINFDEIKELSKVLDYDNSGPAPQLQKTSDHNRSELGIQDHINEPLSSTLVPNVSPLADTNALSLQELEFLFIPLFEEYFTVRNQSMSKSSSLSDNSTKQNIQPTATIQPKTELITLTTNVNAKENNNDQAADAQIDENEFYNIFSTPVREEAKSSTHNVDNSNMHTCYQCHQSEPRWTKDHPLEQVRGNLSKPVQTR